MKKFLFSLIVLATVSQVHSQTVFQIIANSPNHNLLQAALEQEGLDAALNNPAGTFTVFAPDDNAINNIAAALGTDVAGILALPNLTDILTYHVLTSTVGSSAVTNGAIVNALSTTNTLKLTRTSMDEVYVNQAKVIAADITGSNGVVHVIDAVVLPVETVVDVALDNGFTSLATAVVTAELLPALTNPLSTLTVFAPTNEAFDNIAAALGTDIAGLLALPNLADILTYHVLGSEVMAADVTNGAIVQPLSATNSLKLTVTSMGDVYVNQAQVTATDIMSDNGVVHVLDAVVLPVETVVDVALDNGFTSLATAVVTAELLPALTNPLATFTVFTPTNEAFDNIAAALGTDIAGLLALPNLGDILTYHVLGSEVMAADVTNGAIVQPLSATNSLKLTVTSMGNVYVNQAQVTATDIMSDNGVVHVIDAVVLPVETVVDIALENGFTSLATAVVTAELVPALTNPITSLTVFAPTNEAFDNIAAALGTDIAGLLALPNLADILTYHVIGSEVLAADVTNGAIVQPLSESNTLKLTVTSEGDVFVNQAQVTATDIMSDNGVVHVINAVVLPVQTVADVAIENGFTSLTAAVIKAELLPALTNPLATLTVFAPTNEAFDNIAVALGTDIAGLLALPNLADILTYHVLGSEVMAADVTNGAIVQPLSASNTLKLTVLPNGDVFVNQAQVTATDISSDNGVVHVLDAVVLPAETVVDVAIDNGFTTLTTAVVTAGLLPALTNPFATLTVFAPTNDAFAALPAGTVEALLNDIPALTEVLTYHVVGAVALSSSLSNGDMLETLQGDDVTVTIDGTNVFINEAQVVMADIEASNGVVHVINAVLSNTTSVSNIEANKLNIYPNPANTNAFVEFDLKKSAQTEVRIMDINGKLVFSNSLNLIQGAQKVELPVNGIAKGLYIVEIRSNESSTFKKLQIN
jgi:transforming growth factor-beta-induced protein